MNMIMIMLGECMQTNTVKIIMTIMNMISKYDTVRIMYDAWLSLGRNKDG